MSNTIVESYRYAGAMLHREAWVNVYQGFFGMAWDSRAVAEIYNTGDALYRIRVIPHAGRSTKKEE